MTGSEESSTGRGLDDAARYDQVTVHAARHYNEAVAEAERVAGTPRAFAVWKATTYYFRILSARSEGIHQIHTVNESGGQYCTCGLIVPASCDNPLTEPGHLDAESNVTTDVILGIPARRHAAEVDDRFYGVYCHACDWHSALASLEEATRVRDEHRHRGSGPVTRLKAPTS